MARGFTLFETKAGRCAIAWTRRGVVALHLPGSPDRVMAARLAGRAGALKAGTPPHSLAPLLERIARHLSGQPEDLSAAPVDLDGVDPFARRVFEVSRRVERGRIATAAEIAGVIGWPKGAASVTRALAQSPLPLFIPCHRIGTKPLTPFAGSLTREALLSLERPAARVVTPTGDLLYDAAEAIRALGAADPALGRLMARVPFSLEAAKLQSPFEALVRSIVYQQLHGKAAATILGRVKALFPGGKLRPEGILAMRPERLREAGLSGAKTLALKDLAARTVKGELPSVAQLKKMSDEEIIAALTEVRGIGRWTVEMMLMFRLGRPDVLPVGDFGVRKGFAMTYGLSELPTPAALAAHAERWRPYRSVASWYMWRATELPAPDAP